ncbi:hypothetical protein V8B55DRAFT_1446763 [Mucor lusitanicus]|uniref:RING-type domain-containing protein n=1 Tax=Mucor circinelloides f. lusitanicus TaxID=29924 RepID=A0A8H4BNP0_MUCCL|nr:hypothetical protein FB192DRAFT_1358870 [Mucor lusitanicus]
MGAFEACHAQFQIILIILERGFPSAGRTFGRMQFGPCIHCGRIILLANGAQTCGTCHILSSAEREQERNEMTTDDEHHRQQRSRDNHHGDSSEDQESNVVYSDRHDNRTAAAVIDNTVERPNIMDLQTTIGREDLPQMLQRFLSFFDPDNSQQKRASDSEIAALDRRVLDRHDPECGTECAICTELFEAMELAKLPCNHEFHSECILHWLRLNSSCPMCRQSISDHEQQQQQQQPVASTQNEPDLIIMRREMADRMYLENAPLHYMDDVD